MLTCFEQSNKNPQKASELYFTKETYKEHNAWDSILVLFWYPERRCRFIYQCLYVNLSQLISGNIRFNVCFFFEGFFKMFSIIFTLYPMNGYVWVGSVLC